MGIRQVLGTILFMCAIALLIANVAASEYAIYMTYQNSALLIGAIASFGTFASVQHHISRDLGAFRAVFSFFLICTVFGLSVLIVGSLIVSVTNPLVEFVPLVLLSTAWVLSITLPSFSLGRGDFLIFNSLELMLPAVFLLLIYLSSPKNGLSIVIILFLAHTIKSALYLMYVVRILMNAPRSEARARDMFRYGLGAMVTGNIYAIVFRSVFYLIQATLPSQDFNLAAVAWSILERVQNLFTAINLVSFRLYASAKMKSYHVSIIVLATCILYILMISLFTFSLWSIEGKGVIINQSYDGLYLSLIILSPGFLFWGLRSLIQNKYVATGSFGIVLKDLVACCVAIGVTWICVELEIVKSLELLVIVTIVTLMSFIHLAWQERNSPSYT